VLLHYKVLSACSSFLAVVCFGLSLVLTAFDSAREPLFFLVLALLLSAVSLVCRQLAEPRNRVNRNRQ